VSKQAEVPSPRTAAMGKMKSPNLERSALQPAHLPMAQHGLRLHGPTVKRPLAAALGITASRAARKFATDCRPARAGPGFNDADLRVRTGYHRGTGEERSEPRSSGDPKAPGRLKGQKNAKKRRGDEHPRGFAGRKVVSVSQRSVAKLSGMQRPSRGRRALSISRTTALSAFARNSAKKVPFSASG